MSASDDTRRLLAGLTGAVREKVVPAALRALDIGGEQIIGDAQQLTPVDTGALQASGTTLPAEIKGNSIRKEIGFNTEYAAAVHEVLTANHPIGQAKFLETAARQDEEKVFNYVASECKKAMG